MSKDKGANPQAAGGNVVSMPTNCCAEKCTKKSERMNFCGEHYGWFKEGLLNKKGQRPTDFDKKYQAFLMKQKSAA